VFRLTAGLEDARTNGFARRLRDAALRVPALIARAAGRDSRAGCRADLREARRTLEELAVEGEWLRALVYVEPSEAAVLIGRLAAARRDLMELESHLGIETSPRLPESRGGAVEGEKYQV
jgi:hypothetical protein